MTKEGWIVCQSFRPSTSWLTYTRELAMLETASDRCACGRQVCRVEQKWFHTGLLVSYKKSLQGI